MLFKGFEGVGNLIFFGSTLLSAVDNNFVFIIARNATVCFFWVLKSNLIFFWLILVLRMLAFERCVNLSWHSFPCPPPLCAQVALSSRWGTWMFLLLCLKTINSLCSDIIWCTRVKLFHMLKKCSCLNFEDISSYFYIIFVAWLHAKHFQGSDPAWALIAQNDPWLGPGSDPPVDFWVRPPLNLRPCTSSLEALIQGQRLATGLAQPTDPAAQSHTQPSWWHVVIAALSCSQGHLNSIIGPLAKQCTGPCLHNHSHE